jgi:hypothetical protein
LFNEEVKEMKEVMRDMGTDRTQDVMGEEFTL